MVKQTAGRDSLNDFAPKFAELNDDVLFGEVWSREDKLSLKLRSIVTMTALISKGIVDNSLMYHLTTAKKNGVTRTEMAEILTHLAFYAGWPNAWAAFRMAKEVYAEEAEAGAEEHGGFFGMGEPNVSYAKYFIGQSYLKPLTDPKETVFMPEQLAHPSCRQGRRTAFDLRGRRRLVSGRRKAGAELKTGRCCDDPAGSKALARRKERLLVQPPCSGGTGREHQQ